MKDTQYAQSVRMRLSKNKKKATVIYLSDPMPILPFNSMFAGIDFGAFPSSKQEEPMEEKTNIESNPPEEGQLDWDIYNPDSIMQACYKFLNLRKSGYSFYKTAGEDAQKVSIYDFDQNCPRIYFFKDKNAAVCRKQNS